MLDTRYAVSHLRRRASICWWSPCATDIRSLCCKDEAIYPGVVIGGLICCHFSEDSALSWGALWAAQYQTRDCLQTLGIVGVADVHALSVVFEDCCWALLISHGFQNRFNCMWLLAWPRDFASYPAAGHMLCSLSRIQTFHDRP